MTLELRHPNASAYTNEAADSSNTSMDAEMSELSEFTKARTATRYQMNNRSVHATLAMKFPMFEM